MMNTFWAVFVIGFMMLPGTQIALDDHERGMIADSWYDRKLNLVTVQLSERMLDATDSNCEKAAKLFHKICSHGYILKVKPYRSGGWVPSAVNPMTVEWTKVLVGEAPDERKKPAKAGETYDQGRNNGIRPGGKTSRYEVNGTDVYIRKK